VLPRYLEETANIYSVGACAMVFLANYSRLARAPVNAVFKGLIQSGLMLTPSILPIAFMEIQTGSITRMIMWDRPETIPMLGRARNDHSHVMNNRITSHMPGCSTWTRGRLWAGFITPPKNQVDESKWETGSSSSLIKNYHICW
jgi:hypothetical protein